MRKTNSWFGFAMIGLIGCSVPPWTKADTWYIRPDADLVKQFLEEPPLSDDRFLRVIEPEIPTAERLLENRPVVRLTENELELLVGGWSKGPEGTMPFLVRAVNLGGSMFVVHESKVGIWVQGITVGEPIKVMRRSPLVVFVQSLPPAVYATCHLAR